MMAKEEVEILAGVVIGTVKMLTPKSMALLRGLQTQEAKKKNGDLQWHLEHIVFYRGIHNAVVTTTPHDIISPLKFRLTFPMAVNNYYCSRWSCPFKEVIQVLKMYLDTYVCPFVVQNSAAKLVNIKLPRSVEDKLYLPVLCWDCKTVTFWMLEELHNAGTILSLHLHNVILSWESMLTVASELKDSNECVVHLQTDWHQKGVETQSSKELFQTSCRCRKLHCIFEMDHYHLQSWISQLNITVGLINSRELSYFLL